VLNIEIIYAEVKENMYQTTQESAPYMTQAGDFKTYYGLKPS